MGSRKKVRPNPSGEESKAASPSKGTSSSNQPPQSGDSSSHTENNTWGLYGKSWPRGSKAAAVTEVARESIAVAGNIASELLPSTVSLPETPKTFRTPSIQLTKKASLSSRSLPADATTTKINIASNGLVGVSEAGPSAAPASVQDLDMKDERVDSAIVEEPGTDLKEINSSRVVSGAPPVNTSKDSKSDNDSKVAEPGASWLGWIGLGSSLENAMAKGSDTKSSPAEAPKQHQHGDPALYQHADQIADSRQSAEVADSGRTSNFTETSDNQITPSGAHKRSWLQMWGGNVASPRSSLDSKIEQSHTAPHVEAEQSSKPAEESTNSEGNAREEQSVKVASTNRSSASGRSSGWAFWSKDIAKAESGRSQSQSTEAGEFAIAGSPALKPQVDGTTNTGIEVQIKDVNTPDTPNKKTAQPGQSDNEGKAPTPAAAQNEGVPEPSNPTPAKVKAQEVSASKQLEKVLSNQLLPSFRDTFALQESPTWLQSFGRLVNYIKEPENKHVLALRDPPRPKRALTIGVHGYFPGPMIRTVIGQPTGTSLKFSTMIAQAIQRWTEKHNCACEIKKISLEGEGFIADRVDILWKLLLNWLDDIRKADFIMFACHSQGVPVTVMLVSKLIAFGCLNATRIGICAMAGVNLGPFPDYKSRLIGGSAGELFDFAHPESRVSREYEAAIETALDYGARITFVGSIDDQYVSLESSLFAPASHPYIYRAVFVDGRVHAPSFLSHLVGFILKLRNLGVSDHGLLRELSQPLAGSLYTGDGHSRLHDEENLYYLAVEFALETSNVNGIPLRINRHRPTSTPNPYILPFAMRGILEENHVRRELHDESIELLRQFDDWKPTTKTLKDVKFRLEGIRSKL